MKVLVLGAGISGHTAAAFLKKKLGKKHDVIVVSPSQYYQWVPSNIWVGVGRMKPGQEHGISLLIQPCRRSLG